MIITIDLKTDHEAFGNGRYEEVLELILQTLATKVAYGEDEGCLGDLNNNTVCRFTVTR